MVTLDPALWRGVDGLDALLDALGAAAGETRLVGGFVRDALLGETGKDLDLATVHLPAAVIARIESATLKAVPTGLAHGTVTAVLPGGRPVEVTTLRRDVATDGRHALVAFTDDWREDAARRDFTINALSADPSTGAVFDYFDGLADLAARRVRFIGDPLRRIAEDHLRILRFFRFEARFGSDAPDAAALAACVARAKDLLALSRERIAAELLRLLDLPSPERTVAIAVDHAVLAPILPEIDGEGVAALRRLVAREREAEAAPAPVRRLAALLPADRSAAEAVALRLKLANVARARLAHAAERLSGDDVRVMAWRFGRDVATDALLLGDQPIEAVRSRLALLASWERPTFPLSGGELIAMGLPRGPIVAATLAAITEAWLAAGFPDTAWVRDAARDAVARALRDT